MPSLKRTSTPWCILSTRLWTGFMVLDEFQSRRGNHFRSTVPTLWNLEVRVVAFATHPARRFREPHTNCSLRAFRIAWGLGGCWLPGSHDFVRPAVACANVPASRLGDLLHHAGVCEVGSKAPNAKVNTDYQSESRADRGRPRNALSPRSSHTGTTFVELNRGRRCFCRVEGTTVMVTVTSRL